MAAVATVVYGGDATLPQAARGLERFFGSLVRPVEDLILGDQALVCRRLARRERLGSTGVGEGLAAPHCTSPAVSDLVVALYDFGMPVEWPSGSIDGAPVWYALLVLAPPFAADYEGLMAAAFQALAPFRPIAGSDGAVREAFVAKLRQYPDAVISERTV